MPITVISPTTGQASGWGFELVLSSDVVPPVGVTVRWNFRLRQLPPLEGDIFVDSYPYAGPGPLTVFIGEDEPGITTPIPIPNGTWVNGEDAQLVVQLVTPQLEVLAETVVPVVHDTTTGMAHILDSRAQASTGFTAADREVLEVVHQGVGFGIGGGWTQGLGDLLGALGRRIFNDVLIVPDRLGEGQLVPPAPGLFGVPFGIQWQLISKPDGFGIDEGVPDRTEIDFMQLSYMYDSDIGLVPRDSRYVRDLNGRWVWGPEWPDSLDYFIMPGVVVRFWWIVINPSLP